MMLRVLPFALMLASGAASAYEQATHAAITQAAMLASGFAAQDGSDVGSAFGHLGLSGYRPLGNASSYFELVDGPSGLTIFERKVQQFEIDILDNLKFKWDAKPSQAWTMFGAIREDDNPGEDPPTPQDVSPGTLRPLNHFFDPYNNTPLTIATYGVALKNVDWALGTVDVFQQLDTQLSPRKNHFTVPDAREATFRALTLKSPAEGSFVDVGTGDSAAQERQRQMYWATALRAVGDVLHLLQDMAQPQHTRDERHSGIVCRPWACPLGHSSVYEKYIRARTLGQRAFKTLGPSFQPVAITSKPLPLTTIYRIPNFAKYSDFWSTAPGVASLSGNGLADYSNRGFFTEQRNFGSTKYHSPTSNASDYIVRDAIPQQWDDTAPLDSTPIKVYYGQVTDTFDGQSTAVAPLTTYGLWDEFLKAKSKSPKYSLNRLNYDAMADLLLPRAVAYSAGLINFFFRGQILISLPKEGAYAISDHGSTGGFKILRVKVKNTTGSFVDPQGEDQPQHMRGGTFFAVIRYHKDKKYVDSLDKTVGAEPCDDYFEIVNPDNLSASTECREGVEEIVVSDPLTGEALDVNTERTLKFTFSKSPIPYAMTDVMLQIVYRGPLGSEADAVAVGSLDISEPTYFTYQNDTDYVHLGGHVYTRAQVNANPALLALVRPQTCVDYHLSPPRLIASCLTTFDIDIDLSFENVSSPIAHASTLPARRFLRLVYLADVNEPFNPPIKAATRAARAAPPYNGGGEKAYLYHQSVCLPLDPFFVRAREAQLKVIAPGEVEYATSKFKRLRAVNGWQNEACVVNGDDAPPGTPDDRETVMTDLTPDSDEMRPYAVTIADEYQPPPQP